MPNELLRGLALSLVVCASACGSSGGKGGGGQSGTGGEGGNTGGGSGGSSGAFMVVAPCMTAADYQATTSITFPNGDLGYSPKCARVAAGTEVTFMATDGSNFSAHPLEASRKRGNTTDNPIMSVAGGTTRAFMFGVPGFFAYYCGSHGIADEDTGEVGVIWVQ